MGLGLRRKVKKRLPGRLKESLGVPSAPRQVWSGDFMSDSLVTGRSFRVLNILDDYKREALCIHAAFSMPGIRMVEYLKQAIEVYGKPSVIRVDNGPELLSRVFDNYCEVEDIRIQYIEPGKPSQNGFIERFNRTFREDVLDAWLFRDIEHVNQLCEIWREEYNRNHPHKALHRKSPRELLEAYEQEYAPPEPHFV